MSFHALAWAVDQKIDTASEKLVLLIMANFANHINEVYPSAETLMEKTSLDRKTVIKARQSLVQKGFLIDTGKRMGRTGQCVIYRLTCDELKAPKNGSLDESIKPPNFPIESLPKTVPEPIIGTYKNKITTLSWDKLTDPEEISKKDESKAFWDQAVSILISLGVAKPTAQSFTGRCLKMAEKDFQKVLDAMQLAVDNQISDPIPYIITILGGRKKKPKKQQEMENVLEFLRKSREERLRQADDAGGFDGDGDPMLPVPPDDELGSLHEGGDQSFGGSVTRRSAKTSRPKGGHLGKVQVPSIDSGVVGYGEAAQPDDF